MVLARGAGNNPEYAARSGEGYLEWRFYNAETFRTKNIQDVFTFPDICFTIDFRRNPWVGPVSDNGFYVRQDALRQPDHKKSFLSPTKPFTLCDENVFQRAD